MKTITFIRHGQSEANIKRVMSGHSQTLLSDDGKQELLDYTKANLYPEVDMVFSSDLPRAIQTSEIIYPEHQIYPLVQLRETNFGPYEDKPVDEVMEEFYHYFLSDTAQENMETYSTLKKRVGDVVTDIYHQLVKNQKNSAAIIAHNGFLRMVHHLYQETPFEKYRDQYIQNGKGFSLVFDAYGTVIDLVIL